MRALKEKIHQHCFQLVESKLADIQKMLLDTQEAANSETKSSMGDKYETGRAMLHLEKGKLHIQLEEAAKQKKVLDEIIIDGLPSQVELGTFLESDGPFFYVAISVGKVQEEGKEIYVISPVAPLGKALLGKQPGDQFSFMGENYTISQLC